MDMCPVSASRLTPVTVSCEGLSYSSVLLVVCSSLSALLSACSNEAQVVSSEDELYGVGAFVQITEVHDMGDKMRMLIQGHRRWACALIHHPQDSETSTYNVFTVIRQCENCRTWTDAILFGLISN